MNTAATNMSPTSHDVLAASSVYVGYTPGIDILQGLSFRAKEADVTVIIGPNGAGKSTFLKTIFGLLSPHSGHIWFRDKEITSLQPHTIKRLGVSYIPQGINVFPQLTVDENLRMGGWIFRHDRSRLRQQVKRIYELFPVLYRRRYSRATELSGGQAKMLSIAKEIMTDPALLLVDEPSAGLAPNVAAQVYDLLLKIRDALATTIILVDQNIEQSVEIADYVYMFNLGRVKKHGPTTEFTLDRIRGLLQECLLGA